MDLSGVNVDFAKAVSDLLTNAPATKEDAIKRYHEVTILLGKFLTQNLTPVERKAALSAMFLLKDVKVKCW